jgi:hypothetical protein
VAAARPDRNGYRTTLASVALTDEAMAGVQAQRRASVHREQADRPRVVPPVQQLSQDGAAQAAALVLW